MLNMKKAIAAVGALAMLQVCLPDAVRAAAAPMRESVPRTARLS